MFLQKERHNNFLKKDFVTMIDELQKLRELTETLTGNGYLRDQAEEWEYALNAIPNPIYVVSRDHKIKFMNNFLIEKLNLLNKDYENKLSYDIVNDITKEEISFYSEEKLELKDRYIEKLNGWFNIIRSPIYSKTNKLLGYICVMQDITTEKNALQQLKWRTATLDTVFNMAPIGIGLIERDTKLIKTVNKTMLDLTGYSETELIGQTLDLLYPESGIDSFDFGECENLKTVWLTKNGSLRFLYLRLSKVEENGDIVFTAVEVSDFRSFNNEGQIFKEECTAYF